MDCNRLDLRNPSTRSLQHHVRAEHIVLGERYAAAERHIHVRLRGKVHDLGRVTDGHRSSGRTVSIPCSSNRRPTSNSSVMSPCTNTKRGEVWNGTNCLTLAHGSSLSITTILQSAAHR